MNPKWNDEKGVLEWQRDQHDVASAQALSGAGGCPPWPAPKEREMRENLAQFLHDEIEWPEHHGADDWSWPTHDGDDGYRGGCWQKIAPPDLVARFRDIADRIASRFLASPPMPKEGEGDLLKRLRENHRSMENCAGLKHGYRCLGEAADRIVAAEAKCASLQAEVERLQARDEQLKNAIKIASDGKSNLVHALEASESRAVKLQNDCDAWEADYKIAKAEVDELRKALEPFAEQAEEYSEETPDDCSDWPTFEVGDFRQARAALSKVQP